MSVAMRDSEKKRLVRKYNEIADVIADMDIEDVYSDADDVESLDEYDDADVIMDAIDSMDDNLNCLIGDIGNRIKDLEGYRSAIEELRERRVRELGDLADKYATDSDRSTSKGKK